MFRRSCSLAITLACAVGLVACEGPQGPEGPAGATGPAGPTGPTGPTGPAGADANANCTQANCHVGNVTLFAKQVQYEQSTHRQGGNFERSTKDCAICHTHQGFIERITSNAYATAADVLDPAPINCRTCHKIHSTYTNADYALTRTATVPLFNLNYVTGNPDTVNYGAAAGNMCASCHQARKLSPVPVLGGADVTITSSRYGVHHGPQAQVVAGKGAFAFTGTQTIPTGPNTHGNATANTKLCATCHMGQAFGEQAGGHTWKMSYDYHGSEVDNVAGCNTTGCHSNFTNFHAFGDTPADVLALLMQLDSILVAKGVKLQVSPGYAIENLNVYAKTGTFSANLAAAFLNWQLFAEDRSLGIHNPPYVKAVLENTIAAITP